MCEVEFKTVSNYEDIPSERCDVVFVDPSLKFDPSSKLNSDVIMFFDCEDDPKNFNPGVAYESMKHSVTHYAKMNWVDDDRGDGIKNIGFPLNISLYMSRVASLDLPEFNHNNAIPFFVGTGTFLGGYDLQDVTSFNKDNDLQLSSIGIYDDGKPMYNQRIDWLLSLRKNNIPHVGGMVFKEHNLSKEWQSKYFGEGVMSLEMNPISHNDYLNALVNNRVGLCPTGHDRLSWRVFDIMATGAILIWTDHKNQKSMYMPKEYTTIQDGECVGSKLLQLQPDYKELWRANQENRKVFKELSPDKIRKDFMNQL
jgi:hypothetical protein